jgi:hypothetical protein
MFRCHVQPRILRRADEYGKDYNCANICFVVAKPRIPVSYVPLAFSDAMASTSNEPQHESQLSLADFGSIKRLAWDESL